MKKKLTMFLTLFFVGIGILTAQTQVRGTIVDETGEAVIGASILIKGTAQGTVTDIDGNFLLTAPADGTLVVSYVGYETQEVPVSDNVRVVLQTDTELLDEVLVVAYGVTRRSSFTGSASQVSGEKIQKLQVSSLSKSLEGASSGVQISSSNGTPGSNANIIIRGIGSITASQQPLIVLDGVPYEGSLNSIPTQDIESLTILKDAAANSMYGARGSNGVIVITTKKGVAGQTRVTFDGRYGFNTRGVPTYNIISEPGEYYEMMFESIANRLAGSTSMLNARLEAANNLITTYLKYNVYKGVADNNVIDPYTGRLSAAAAAAPLKWNDSWQKDPFKNGARQEYNVGISGGNEKTQAYASLSYLGDEGYIENSGFDRITVRAKVDQSVGSRIKTGINLSYANTTQKIFGSTGSNYSNLFMFSQQIAPIFPIYLYDEDGELMYDNTGRVLYDFGTRYTRPYAQEQNPYAVMQDNDNQFISDNLSSRGYLNYSIFDDLVLTFNLAYDVFNQTNNEYNTPNGGDAASVGGRGYKTSTRYAAMNANQLLNWTPSFDKHSFNLLLGHETKNDVYKYLWGHMTNFVNPNNSDFANAAMYQDLTSYTTEYALEGYFSRLEYNYADKYYFSTSLRRDASSRFHPDVRWGTFYSFGGAWRVIEEDFMSDYTDILHNVRLKASYGTQGNDNLGYSKVYNDLYDISRIDGEPGLTKVFRGNPELTWEKSNNFNVGLELGLYNRINFSTDFFVKETKDMLYSRPYSPSDGSPSWMYVNDIDMKNVGVEFELNADVIKNNDFTWNVAFNGTHYKNKLTRLPSDKDPDGYQAGSYWRKVGGSLYDYYTYEYAGVDPENGLPLYNKYTEKEDGTEEVTTVNKTSEASLRETGKSSIPDFYGGVSTTLESRGFDFSVSTAFQLGGYVWDSFYQNLMNPGSPGENMHTDMFNRWTPAYTNTNVPKLTYEDQDSNSSADRWLTKASYFSLRNVTLGYTVPSDMIRKADIQSLRVYLTGDNIWFSSKRKGLDPRQSFTGSTGYIYSALSTYSLGVSLTF